MTSALVKAFGRHIRSLRVDRGLTQEKLAEKSELSPDTIRRLEQGSFSPSLATLNKLCVGLELELSTLFTSFELGRCEDRELVDLIRSRKPGRVRAVTKVVTALFDALDELAADDRAEDEDAR